MAADPPNAHHPAAAQRPAPREAEPVPTKIVVHEVSRVLEIEFSDGVRGMLPFEYLRVLSPSAEVKGHGPGQETLQVGKEVVTVTAIEPVGHYALQPTFSDGHDTGIYSWTYLHDLSVNRDALWADYLRRLDQAGHGRRAGGPGEKVAGADDPARRIVRRSADGAGEHPVDDRQAQSDVADAMPGQSGIRAVTRPQ